MKHIAQDLQNAQKQRALQKLCCRDYPLHWPYQLVKGHRNYHSHTTDQDPYLCHDHQTKFHEVKCSQGNCPDQEWSGDGYRVKPCIKPDCHDDKKKKHQQNSNKNNKWNGANKWDQNSNKNNKWNDANKWEQNSNKNHKWNDANKWNGSSSSQFNQWQNSNNNIPVFNFHNNNNNQQQQQQQHKKRKIPQCANKFDVVIVDFNTPPFPDPLVPLVINTCDPCGLGRYGG